MTPLRRRDFVTLCDLFLILLFYFFSVSRLEHISRPICTRTVSFDVNFYKEVPFGGKNTKHSCFWGPRALKPPKFSPGIGFPMLISMLNNFKTVRDRQKVVMYLIGCFVGRMCTGSLAYADDLTLLA